jgi:hypothetical protein
MASGFEVFSAVDVAADHGGTAKEWKALATHFGLPTTGWTAEQVAELVGSRDQIKAGGQTIAQFLQGVPTEPTADRGVPDSFDTTALVQAAVAPGIQGIATGLGHVQNGLTQVIEQGSDALVSMNQTAWPATLAMAANKGAAAAAQGSNNAIEQEVARAFDTFRLPTRFVTTIAPALPARPVAGAIAGATSAGQGESRHA